MALAFVAMLILPTFARAKKGRRIHCPNHLKQISLGLQLYANDFQNRWSWQVSTNQGGSMEFVGSGEVFRHFQVMSNELGRPTLFVCPDDKQRAPAHRWTNGFNNGNLSYFAAVDAAPGQASAFLSGDRSLSTNDHMRAGRLTLTTNSPVRWANGIHAEYGFVAFTDGSVSKLTSPDLPAALQRNTHLPARLEIP